MKNLIANHTDIIMKITPIILLITFKTLSVISCDNLLAKKTFKNSIVVNEIKKAKKNLKY